MKQFFILILLLLCLSVAGQSWAAEYTCEWGYTPPSEPAVTGFRLYKNGTTLIDFTGAAITSGVFNATLTIGDIFELTALFADSTESPKSATYTWTGGSSFIRFGRLNPTNSHGRTDKAGQVRIQ